MLNLLRTLFDVLRVKNVRCCSWKSNIRLEEALLGKTDIDLLVDRRDAFSFLSVLSELGFREQISPVWASFPAISHFIGYDTDASEFAHLHVHYRLLMGKSFLKSYHVPLEDFLLANTKQVANIRVPVPAVEVIIHVIRMAVKRTFFAEATMCAERFFGWRASDGMSHELAYLVRQTNGDELEAMLEKMNTILSSKCCRLIQDVATHPETVSAMVLRTIRKELYRFRRYGHITETFSFLWRQSVATVASIAGVANKKVFSGGAIFALVGADGAGKTTVVRELMARLGRKIRVRSYYLGSNQYTARTWIIWAFFAGAVVINKLLPSLRNVRFIRSLLAGLLEYSFARDRSQRYRRGWRHAANGTIVIFERFPIANVIDHPSVTGWDSGWEEHSLIVWLRGRISRIYDEFRDPRLFMYLSIDPAVAVARKKDVHKLETVGSKEERLSGLLQRDPDKVLKIEATLPLGTVVKETLASIWGNL